MEQSTYLQVLPQGASVLADRGFKHVAAIMLQNNCTLFKPPSVSSDEVMTTKIAPLRIHIERVIRRLREFAMLVPHSSINNKLLYLKNHIMIIACVIVNLQDPLIL